MAHYVQKLSDETFAQYEQIFKELRKSQKYKKYEETQSLNEKLKLSLDLFKEFEKKAKDIKDFKQERSFESKPKFLDRLLHPTSQKETYTPTYVEKAFYDEMQHPGSFKKTYNENAENYNEFFKLSPQDKNKSGVVVYNKDGQVMGATTKNAYQTVSELRGTAKPKEESPQIKASAKPQNALSKLDDKQFAEVLAKMEVNLCRMQTIGADDSIERGKMFQDIKLVLDEASRRYGQIQPSEKGSFFTDKEVSGYEAAIFSYAKHANKDHSGVNDLAKIEQWRQGKDYEQGSIKEAPFNNTSIYGSGRDGSLTHAMQYDMTSRQLNASELAAAKAQVSKMHIH